MTIKAYRAGETVSRWSNDPYYEKLSQSTDQILFDFSMPSKGGGVTEVQLRVTGESFDAIAKAMFDANMDAAVLAFVSTESFGLIARAMMDADEDHAIAAFGNVLYGNKDRTIGACGAILLDKREARIASESN